MAERYARLKGEWLLRGWTDVPRALVNWTTGEQLELRKKGFYVTEACDGNTDFNSLAFLPAHHALLDRLIEKGIAESCEEGNSINSCQQYRKAPNPRLGGLLWSVTGLCNLNCIHCYMKAPSGLYGELRFEEMIHLIDEFERANVHQVSLTGGEPFLRKDLLDIITMLAQKKIWLSQIFTNGLLVTEEVLEEIRRIGFLPSIQISFDGCGAHDYMRGMKGIEQEVIEAIRRVRAAGFPVVIATSVDRVSKGSLTDTYELLRGMDIGYWRIALPYNTGNWRGATTALSFEEEAEIYAPLLGLWLADGKPFDLELGGFFEGASRRNRPGPEREETIRYAPENYDCGACREMPNLLPDGTLLPCPGYTDTILHDRMPNVIRLGLSKALIQPFFRSIADMKKSDLLLENEECNTCELFELCGMGCRAIAVASTGELMAKDPVACRIWKEGYKQRFRDLTGLTYSQ